MSTATLILFFIISIISFLISRSIFHPSVIVSSIWGLLLVLYRILDHPLWILSDKFYIAIMAWVCPFCIISLCITNINGTDKKSFLKKSHLKSFNILFYTKLLPHIVTLSGICCILLLVYCGGNLGNLRLLLVDGNFPIYIKMIFYLSTFLIVYFFFGLLNSKEIKNKDLILLFVSLLAISLLRSNKTSFLSLFVSSAYILYKKKSLKLRYILYLIIMLALMLIVVSLSRDDYNFENSSAIENFIYIYLLSPLTAFDLIINNNLNLGEGTPGESIFIFIYRILNVFGCNLSFTDLGTWVNVPLPTNVYTAMRAFYLEGGIGGIMMGSSILAIIWGVMYRWQKKSSQIAIVFYACMLSSLFFQSFGDYFFYTFSVTIQYLIFSIIIFHGISIFPKRRISKKYYNQ